VYVLIITGEVCSEQALESQNKSFIPQLTYKQSLKVNKCARWYWWWGGGGYIGVVMIEYAIRRTWYEFNSINYESVFRRNRGNTSCLWELVIC
jgi:hypothetical protein